MVYQALVRPFSSDDIFKIVPSQERPEETETWQGFQLDTKLQSQHFTLVNTEDTALHHLKANVLKLDLQEPTIPETDISVGVSPTLAVAETELNHNYSGSIVEHEDIWTAAEVQRPSAQNRVIAWDQFLGVDETNLGHECVSESSPGVYDALLRTRKTIQKEPELRYVRPQVFIGALCNLAAGRESALFAWDEKSSVFQRKVQDYTLTGFSEETSMQLFHSFATSGTRFRRLTRPAKSNTATSITVRGAVLVCLHALEEYLISLDLYNLTVLRLQQAWSVPNMLLTMLEHVIQPTLNEKDEGDQISKIVSCLNEAFANYSCFRGVINAITQRLLQASLHSLTIELGYDRGYTQTDTAVSLLRKILPTHTVALMDETMTNLTVLRENAFGDLYWDKTFLGSNPQLLKLVHKWADVVELQRHAGNYEEQMHKHIHGVIQEETQRRVSINDESHVEAAFMNKPSNAFELDLAVYDEMHTEPTEKVDVLKVELDHALDQLSTQEPFSLSPLQALEMSLTPMMSAQHRLMSYMIIRSLFVNHHLIANTEMLHRYLLLSDGMFVEQLSRALFDSQQIGGETSRHLGTVSGLRLLSRDTWPPASTELRLVLMSVLSRSVSDANLSMLQNTISFSIRELSDDELERCRSLHSIFALDFLRLSYKPLNTTLEVVLANESLEKLDRIFRHLLLLLRMKAVAESMVFEAVKRNTMSEAYGLSHRFRLQLFRFVSAVVDYSQNTAVSVPWNSLVKTLMNINESIARQDYPGIMNVVSSVSQLRGQYENTMDKILAALLLKGKQSEAKHILDDIFTITLEFASIKTASQGISRSKLSLMYKNFSMKVSEFVKQVRRINSRMQESETQLPEQLLVKLDMYNFYES